MIKMNYHKFIPLILLIFIVPSTAYAHVYTHVFSDDFNRVDNDDVGIDWPQSERESKDYAIRIVNYAMTFFGIEAQTSRPCVYTEFVIPPTAENIQINFTYNFRPLTTLDAVYNIQVRMGEDMTCNTKDPSLVARLFHSDASKVNVTSNGSFGHYVYGDRNPTGVVDGLVDVSIIINNNDSVYSYTVTGSGLQTNDIDVENVPFINILSLNSTVFKLNRVDGQIDDTFLNTLIVDDFTVNTFPVVVGNCGVSLDSLYGFGAAKRGEFSDKVPIELVGIGDVDSLVNVSGSNWIDVERPEEKINIINVEHTHFSKYDNIAYDLMDPLTEVPQELGVVSHHHSQMTYWEAKLIVNDPDFNDRVKQTITFDVDCI